MKEENCKPVSKLLAEEKGSAEADGVPEGTLPEIVTSTTGVKSREESSRSGNTVPAQVIDDEVNRFIKAEVAAELEVASGSRHELDEVVRRLLLAGLALSTILIVVGLLLSRITHRQLPSAASGLNQVFQNLKIGAPSGFLDLGILLLIATPILRVFGSLAEFIYRRDWRYVAITSVVLLILAISVLAGRG